ncbi:hypothetical protein Pelo_2024 [Pelomyxa schiedti]|nr:hypothetical protein Pelo_2024 [Pelomyxa schiedti]
MSAAASEEELVRGPPEASRVRFGDVVSCSGEDAAVIDHIRAVHGIEDSACIVDWVSRSRPRGFGIMATTSRQTELLGEAASGGPIGGGELAPIGGAGREVAAWMCLIPTDLVFDGVVLHAAQMGIVGTLPQYRGKGFIRKLSAQFEAEAAARNMPLLIIAGIPHFYRKVGYDYGMKLPWWVECRESFSGGKGFYIQKVEQTGQMEEYVARRSSWWERLVECYRFLDVKEVARISSFARISDSVFCGEFYFLRRQDTDAVCGLFSLFTNFGKCIVSELYIDSQSEEFIENAIKVIVQSSIPKTPFPVVVEQPVQKIVEGVVVRLTGLKQFPPPYSWWTKVPDMHAFMQVLLPVLSKRLRESSTLNTYTGSLVLHSFEPGKSLRLAICNGQVASLTRTTEEDGEPDQISYRTATPTLKPGHPEVFASCPAALTHLLLGRHSLDEVIDFFPDTCARATMLKKITETLLWGKGPKAGTGTGGADGTGAGAGAGGGSGSRRAPPPHLPPKAEVAGPKEAVVTCRRLWRAAKFAPLPGGDFPTYRIAYWDGVLYSVLVKKRVVRMIDERGEETYAGKPQEEGVKTARDGPFSTALFSNPELVSVSPHTGEVFVFDEHAGEWNLRKLSSGLVTTVRHVPRVDQPCGSCFDMVGNIYVCSQRDNDLWKISSTGSLKKLSSGFKRPAGVILGNDSFLYVADSADDTIKKCDPNSGDVSIFLSRAYDIDGNQEKLSWPYWLVLSPYGDMFLSECLSEKIRRITPDGIATTIAASGHNGLLKAPLLGMVLTKGGSLLVGDKERGCIWKITRPLPLFYELRPLFIAWKKNETGCIQRGLPLHILQLIIEFAWDCTIPRPLQL